MAQSQISQKQKQVILTFLFEEFEEEDPRKASHLIAAAPTMYKFIVVESKKGNILAKNLINSFDF